MKKLLFIFGTRPEAIKLAPLIKMAAQDKRFEVEVCSTGQHREMLKPVCEAFGIRPHHDFELMRPGQTLTDITTAILDKKRHLVQSSRPDWVIVQGDTTTAMAASLSAFYEKIPVAHVEAGLRTHDIDSPFPEELNRRVTALIARLHFAPTFDAAENLLREGIEESRISITGNTGIDALLSVKESLSEGSVLAHQYSEKFGFLDGRKRLLLATIHRRESFGEPMREILKGLVTLSEREDVEILLPLHLNPEVRRAAEAILDGRGKWANSSSRAGESKIWLTDPQDYLSFVYLMMRSYFIISDSGGVQEEAPSLGRPVLVVRESTERPEAIKAGTSRLIGANAERLIAEASLLLDNADSFQKMARAHNPYGDGRASSRILDRIYEGWQ